MAKKTKTSSKSKTVKAASAKAADSAEPTRRDMLYISTGAMAAVGAAGVAWPMIDQMNPNAATLALSTVEVDIGGLEKGQEIKLLWRGKPVFVRNRTDKEVEEANKVALADLKDKGAENENLEAGADASGANRSAGEGKENLIVMVGSCTHLGCIPVSQQGDFGGWFCPCHGSHYDTAGRIRKGPAPKNLLIPTFTFTGETTIKIG